MIVGGGTGEEGGKSGADNGHSRACIGAGKETNVIALSFGLSNKFIVLGKVVAAFVGGFCNVHLEGYAFDIVLGNVPWYVGKEHG